MSPKSNNPNLLQLCQAVELAGSDVKPLKTVLTKTRSGRRVGLRRVGKLRTHQLNRLLRSQRKSPEFEAIGSSLGTVLNFAVEEGMIAKNPLTQSVGAIRHMVARSFALVAAVLVISLGSFGFQVIQRAQQTQEDIILATADVARDLGWGQAVATLENYYYGQLNPSKVGGKPTAPVVDKTIVGAEPTTGVITNAKANVAAWGPAEVASAIPPRVISPAKDKLPGEGVWLPTKLIVNGQVAARVARVRPDDVHTSFLDSLIWFDPKLVTFQEVAGTAEPKGNFARGQGKVSSSLEPFYLAGINGGYKTDNMHGGFYYHGQSVIGLVNGAATFLTYPNGSFNVVNWGHDPVAPGYSAARQNLTMLVENGKNMAKKDNAAKWGSANQGVSSGHIFVWRSAIGVRADGTVVHLVGPSLSTRDLADLLIRAGVVRGMALDMNNGWASSYFYGPYGAGVPMDPQITHTVSRFKARSTRDFIAVFAKSPAQPAK